MLDDREHHRARPRVPDRAGVKDDQRAVVWDARRAIGEERAGALTDIVMQPLSELREVRGELDVGVLASFLDATVELLLQHRLARALAGQLTTAVHRPDRQ